MSVRTTVFYSGEQMEPATIRRADPTARFIARGAVERGDASVPAPFAGRLRNRVWGIVVETAGGRSSGGPSFDVTLDDGRMLTATLAEPLLDGDATTVLANARYWELPPAYVRLLAEALSVVEEE